MLLSVVCLYEMPCGSRPSKARARLYFAVLQLLLLTTCAQRWATLFASIFFILFEVFFLSRFCAFRTLNTFVGIRDKG